MAMDYHLLIDGVPGESLDVWNRDAIVVQSWSWGMLGEGSGTEPAAQSLSLVKLLDRASPLLLAACHAGRLFERATLVATLAGERPLNVLQLLMKGVTVEACNWSGGSPELVNESLSLRFQSVQLVYVAQRADGSPDATFATADLALSAPALPAAGTSA